MMEVSKERIERAAQAMLDATRKHHGIVRLAAVSSLMKHNEDAYLREAEAVLTADDSAAWQIAEKLAEALERTLEMSQVASSEWLRANVAQDSLSAYQEARKQATDRVGE